MSSEKPRHKFAERSFISRWSQPKPAMSPGKAGHFTSSKSASRWSPVCERVGEICDAAWEAFAELEAKDFAWCLGFSKSNTCVQLSLTEFLLCTRHSAKCGM